MDFGGLPNKIISGVEKHATLLAFAAGCYMRKAESNPDPGVVLEGLARNFTDLRIVPLSQKGQGGYGVLGEALLSLQDWELLTYKVFNSPHAYSALVKVGIIGWIAGQLGVIPSKYGTLAGKVAMGAGFAALVMPGSGDSGSRSSGSSGYNY